MNSKILKLAFASTFILSVVSVTLCMWQILRSNKTGYVDTIKVLNEYRLKIDLEQAEGIRLRTLRSHSDSLTTVYRLLKSDPTASKESLQVLESQVTHVGTMLQEEFTRSNDRINQKLWNRLNSDIAEYGRMKNIDLLVGADGTGTVLYGSTTHDYTSELITFLNKRYLDEI